MVEYAFRMIARSSWFVDELSFDNHILLSRALGTIGAPGGIFSECSPLNPRR
jgi:hypothetical protein